MNKRKVVGKPQNMTTTEETVYDYLASQYPTPKTCEDIFAVLIKQKDQCDTLEKLWEVMDHGVLKDICEVKRRTRYVLVAE